MCWRPPKFWVVKPMLFRGFPSSFLLWSSLHFPPVARCGRYPSCQQQRWWYWGLLTPGTLGTPPTDLLMFSMNMYEPSNSLAMLVLKFDSPPWKNDKQWHIQWVFVHDVSTIKLAVWSRSVVCSDNVPRVAKRWRLSAWDFCSPPIIPIIPIIHQTHHPSFSQCQYLYDLYGKFGTSKSWDFLWSNDKTRTKKTTGMPGLHRRDPQRGEVQVLWPATAAGHGRIHLLVPGRFHRS